MPNKLKTNKFKNNAEENETSQHTRVSGQSRLQVSFCNATCWMMKVRLLTSNKLINLITQQIERDLEIQIELSEVSVICCRDVFLTHDDDSKFLRIPFLTQCK